jgi:ADP-ribosyl-[dinitrogen reductase] hydrolase
MRNVDRARGCLIGLAIGDALGAPVEFKSPQQIRNEYGPEGVTELTGGGVLGWKPGEYTDDTQLALVLAHSLVRTNRQQRVIGLDIDDFGRGLVEWLNSKPRDVGMTIGRALYRLKWENVPASESGDPHPDSQSNGAVMRVAPLALLWHRPQHLKHLLEDATFSAYPTHRALIPIQSCKIFCQALTECIQRGTFDPLKIPTEQEWAYTIDKHNLKNNYKPQNTGWAVTTVLDAFHYVQTTSSFEEAVKQAVNNGGDADTVGAVTGALAGAKYGLEAIPDNWLHSIKDSIEILALAEVLFYLAENYI